MAQIFAPRANGLAHAVLLAVVASILGVAIAAVIHANSPGATGQNVADPRKAARHR